MKLFKLAPVICLSMFLTTGCITNTESPEELAKIPVYNENESEIYNGIKGMLINSSLILPKNSKDVGKINEVDLNNDQVKEIVAFEKKKTNLGDSDESQVGLIVLSQNMNNKNEIVYSQNGSILEDGESIEYANFYDLEGDGYKEIILLINQNDNIIMNIYKYKNNEIVKIYTLNPWWLPNITNQSKLKIKIGYIDDDPELDILMLHIDSDKNEAYVSIADFDGKLNLKDSIKIENIKSSVDLNDIYITIGNIATSKRGILIDYPSAKENNYITQVMYIDDNKLYKAFDDYDTSIKKAYYIPVEDVNNDKVIDIPIVNGNGHAYSSKSSANISWHRWNGKKGDESGLLFTSKIYYNYQYNFKFLIPNNLVKQISIEQDYSSENITYNFNYYNNLEVESKTLFSISVVNKVINDENKNITSKAGIILGENDEHTFILNLNDIESLEKLDITSEALVENFSLIYH